MKYTTIALIASSLFAGSAIAAEESKPFDVTVGYATADVDLDENMKGFSLTVSSSPKVDELGFISTFSIVSHEFESTFVNINSYQWNLMGGGIYQVHEYVGLYLTGGLSFAGSEFKTRYDSASDDSMGLALGGGVRITPYERLVINVGFEKTSHEIFESDFDSTGFTIGAGLKF